MPTTKTESVKIENLEGWSDLTAAEQKKVLTETAELEEALVFETEIPTMIAQHLLKLQTILEPKRIWGKYLALVGEKWGKAPRTLYRYIEDFREVEVTVPAHAIKEAAKQGVDLIGRPGKKARAAIPISRSASQKETKAWVNDVAKHKREAKAAAKTREFTIPESVAAICRLFYARWQDVPKTGKTPHRFLEDTVGGILAIAGVSHMTFHATAIPEGIVPVPKKRGRPKKLAVAAAA